MAEFDAILQQMKDLTETVKDHKDDRATIDMAAVEAQFKGQIEALVEQQVADKLASRPVYRTPGEPVELGGDVAAGLKGNRYQPIVKTLAKTGKYMVGTKALRPLDLQLAHMLLTKAHGLMPDRVQAPSEDLRAAIKALTSTGSGSGDELVPTNMAAELWQDIFLASKIGGAMTTIQMPSNPFDVPLGLGEVTWRKGTEGSATTATDLATAKSTLTATELVAEVNWSYSLDEDAVVVMMPAIRERIAISGAEVVDAFALNADSTNSGTGNINLDDADPADTSYYLSAGQDGIRHQWLVDYDSMANSAAGASLADSHIAAALVDMGKYAVNPAQCVMVADISTYLTGLLDLDAVQTIDKFGPSAVVMTGQLAAYRGIPIVVSASAPKTEADGKVSTTSGNNVYGQISIFNRNMWYLGFRRDLLIEVDRNIQTRLYLMVVSLREAVGCHGTRASATHTAGVYYIGL